jgi:2-polyprenyl-3-methyl-5-hydroxy-6-metoxy-1,4-benzoquinol methylase
VNEPERIAAHYDDLAPHWADIIEASEWREGLWMTVDELLPAVEGKHVLDAGCGAGVYAEVLAQRGADVTGVDVSEAMLTEARERIPEATFHHADLAEGVDCLDANSVDVVLCQHVFSHLPDLSAPLAEFARVLDDDGVLVVSTHNPVHDYVLVRDGEYPTAGAPDHLDPETDAAADAPTYSETERFDIVWGSETGSDRGTYYRRPIQALFEPVLDAGFAVESVVEPTLDDGEADAGDESADLPPDSICLRATVYPNVLP